MMNRKKEQNQRDPFKIKFPTTPPMSLIIPASFSSRRLGRNTTGHPINPKLTCQLDFSNGIGSQLSPFYVSIGGFTKFCKSGYVDGL